MGRPSLFQWTKRQYKVMGPFDKWLRSVKTCRTIEDCCGPSGFSNIIIRDFPTRAFTSNVIAKNYQLSLTASGFEGQCYRFQKQKAEAAQKAKELAEKIEANKAAEKAEKERKAQEAAKFKAKEEEKKQKESENKAKVTTSLTNVFKNTAAKAAAAAKNAAQLAAQKAAAQKAAAAALKAVGNLLG